MAEHTPYPHAKLMQDYRNNPSFGTALKSAVPSPLMLVPDPRVGAGLGYTNHVNVPAGIHIVKPGLLNVWVDIPGAFENYLALCAECKQEPIYKTRPVRGTDARHNVKETP